MRKGMSAMVFGLLIAFGSSPALAVDAVPCDPDDDLETILLDSDASIHFNGCYLVEPFDPEVDNPVNVTVDWEATNATCTFLAEPGVTLRGRGYTPPPADGGNPVFVMTSGDGTMMGTVEFEVEITDLKTAGRAKQFAVGHYAVPLECTIDGGDPIQVFLGVNLRVEQEIE